MYRSTYVSNLVFENCERKSGDYSIRMREKEIGKYKCHVTFIEQNFFNIYFSFLKTLLNISVKKL